MSITRRAVDSNNPFGWRPPNICQRAAALWTLMEDFREAAAALPGGELSRRCEDIAAAVEFIEKRVASRHPQDEDE